VLFLFAAICLFFSLIGHPVIGVIIASLVTLWFFHASGKDAHESFKYHEELRSSPVTKQRCFRCDMPLRKVELKDRMCSSCGRNW